MYTLKTDPLYASFDLRTTALFFGSLGAATGTAGSSLEAVTAACFFVFMGVAFGAVFAAARFVICKEAIKTASNPSGAPSYGALPA